MNKRKPIGTKIRFEVFKRDGFFCQYCGAHPPISILQVDHIVPVKEGGENDLDNLITACQTCNIGKGARCLSSVPKSLSEKTAEIIEQEKQLKGYYDARLAKLRRLESEAEWISDLFSANFGVYVEYSERSIKLFLEKLSFFDVKEAMLTALERVPGEPGDCFKYFCGICWKKIKEAKDGPR